MIDPVKITRYDLSKEELEETILFCICVAGKNARTTAKALDRFLEYGHRLIYGNDVYYEPVVHGQCRFYKPFDMIKSLISVMPIEHFPILIASFGFGCYNHRARSFKAIVNSGLDLKTCSTKDLEKISGIGMKTSRYFILHTRKNAKVVPIDTHVLKYLKEQGVIPETKISLTPKTYLRLEKEYIKLWKKYGKGLTLAEFDLGVWNHYAGHKKDYRLFGSNQTLLVDA